MPPVLAAEVPAPTAGCPYRRRTHKVISITTTMMITPVRCSAIHVSALSIGIPYSVRRVTALAL